MPTLHINWRSANIAVVDVNLVGHPEAPLILIRLSRLDGCRPPVSQGFPVDPILLLFNEAYFSLWELAERFVPHLRSTLCVPVLAR